MLLKVYNYSVRDCAALYSQYETVVVIGKNLLKKEPATTIYLLALLNYIFQIRHEKIIKICIIFFLYIFIPQTLLCNQPGILQFPDLLTDALSSAQLPYMELLQYPHLLKHNL